ncbi:hypothetical protein SAMN05421759_102224 [Roseivivax lentus]|uniref:DUF1150 family protein n=1 Tax=Roseivivax lentus TaxID=633194 RepID=A0A1N7KZW0_9RHOB|nr:DUF1150 family protein [Roseivivax lentus]SIS67046.1 hypothetical protein SAMN05421759_102224 [Roseivivax lentus]
MNTAFDFSKFEQGRTVYIRPVKVADLPEDMRQHAGGSEELYAVHASDGERLALVKERNLAFILARQNDMSPVTVH